MTRSAPIMTFFTSKSVSAIALSLTFAYSLTLKAPVSAQTTPPPTHFSDSFPAFVPPSNPRRRSGGNDTTGSRTGSCTGSDGTSFTLLSPVDTIGYAASPQPTVSWYLPSSEVQYPVQVKFFLESQDGEKYVEVVDVDYQPGITTYSIPPEKITLMPGMEYGWQVRIECDKNRPSRSLLQRARVEVVQPSIELQQAIEAATTDAERALAYGRESIWYDAIAQVAQSESPEAIAVRHELLLNLATYLSTVETSNARDQILEIIQENIENNSGLMP